MAVWRYLQLLKLSVPPYKLRGRRAQSHGEQPHEIMYVKCLAQHRHIGSAKKRPKQNPKPTFALLKMSQL
jgi:hypothetical protein